MNEKVEELINHANGSIIGLGVDSDEDWTSMKVFVGYDGAPDFEGEEWTVEDKKALADFMIAKWQEFKDRLYLK